MGFSALCRVLGRVYMVKHLIQIPKSVVGSTSILRSTISTMPVVTMDQV